MLTREESKFELKLLYLTSIYYNNFKQQNSSGNYIPNLIRYSNPSKESLVQTTSAGTSAYGLYSIGGSVGQIVMGGLST